MFLAEVAVWYFVPLATLAALYLALLPRRKALSCTAAASFVCGTDIFPCARNTGDWYARIPILGLGVLTLTAGRIPRNHQRGSFTGFRFCRSGSRCDHFFGWSGCHSYDVGGSIEVCIREELRHTKQWRRPERNYET